jgi:hypothetical protein
MTRAVVGAVPVPGINDDEQQGIGRPPVRDVIARGRLTSFFAD